MNANWLNKEKIFHRISVDYNQSLVTLIEEKSDFKFDESKASLDNLPTELFNIEMNYLLDNLIPEEDLEYALGCSTSSVIQDESVLKCEYCKSILQTEMQICCSNREIKRYVQNLKNNSIMNQITSRAVMEKQSFEKQKSRKILPPVRSLIPSIFSKANQPAQKYKPPTSNVLYKTNSIDVIGIDDADACEVEYEEKPMSFNEIDSLEIRRAFALKSDASIDKASLISKKEKELKSEMYSDMKTYLEDRIFSTESADVNSKNYLVNSKSSLLKRKSLLGSLKSTDNSFLQLSSCSSGNFEKQQGTFNRIKRKMQLIKKFYPEIYSSKENVIDMWARSDLKSLGEVQIDSDEMPLGVSKINYL